jgi:thiol oxidase
MKTPYNWEGCKGSQPHLRGYPCGLWKLFHTLMVNAAIQGDPSMALGGASSVAKTMVNYIYYFFSCRHCADNFSVKVNSLGFLPSTPRDSILWLWQIHNLANAKLKGSFTIRFKIRHWKYHLFFDIISYHLPKK